MDWNDDGNMDLLVSDTTARMWFALNTPVDGVPTFGALQPVTYTSGGQATNPAGKAAMWVVDWDDDGKKDIITGGEGDSTDWIGQCYFFRNTGTDAAPTFASPVAIGGGIDFGWRTSPVAVDWDGDGKKDIVTSSVFGDVKFFRNTGTDAAPTFSVNHTTAPFVTTPTGDLSWSIETRVRLVDWDGDGREDLLIGDRYGTVRLYIRNHPPLANAGADSSGQQGVAVSLNGSATTDPEGDTLSYHWTLISKPATSAATITNPDTVASAGFTPDRTGTYEVQLTVADGHGAPAVSTRTISVAGGQTVQPFARSLDEDARLSFATADFAACFGDLNEKGLQDVTITSLPGHGALTLGDVPVTVNQEIPADQLGNLAYAPAGDYNGTDGFGWNGSDGLDYALNATTVTLTVRPVNDAPVLSTTGLMMLAPIDESDSANAGTTVSAIIAYAGGDRITDADAGALEGIAVTAVDDADGAWQYSTDGGANWSAFGPPDATAARLLRATDRARFVPNADWNGTVSGGLTFRAWDQTTGAAGQAVDLSAPGATGGTTAYSVDSRSAGIKVGSQMRVGGASATSYYDANNELVKVTLTGGGTGTIFFRTTPVKGGGVDAREIRLQDTGPKSVLTITTTGACSATTVRTIDVLGNGSLGAITARTTCLAGTITVPGLLGSLTLSDVAGGSAIDIDAALTVPGTTQLALALGRVADTSVDTHSLPIRSITATEWTNAPGSGVEQIAAPWIGAITTVGRKANARAAPPVVALAGDFQAELVLSGQGVPLKAATLGTVKIAGSVEGAGWAVNGDAGAVTIAGAVEDWTLQGGGAGGAGLGSVRSLTLGDVDSAAVQAGGVLGAVKALRWAAGAIQANSLVSLTVTGRKPSAAAAEILGDFGAAVVLHGQALAPAKPAAGAVSIAHDLDASLWDVTGPMTTFTVTHTALDSTVRASGSIAKITLGSGDGSRFLAGVTSGQLDPAAIISADLDATAGIGSLAIKGWAVPRGQAAPDFLADTIFLAPSLGAVALLNSPPDTWALYALTPPGGGSPRIKSVTHKDTREPSVAVKNWTWAPGKPMPAGAGSGIHGIF